MKDIDTTKECLYCSKLMASCLYREYLETFCKLEYKDHNCRCKKFISNDKYWEKKNEV